MSKWERAEASPDTDNLILLSRLYGISLDELLKTDEEIPRPLGDADKDRVGEIVPAAPPGQEAPGTGSGRREDEYVHVGFEGVHVKDAGGEVHVGWNGIHVDDKRGGDNVHIDRNGVYVNGERYDKAIFLRAGFPVAMVVCIAYLIIGCVYGAWHPGWLLFLLIPIWYSLLEAVEKRNAFCFAWHPGWVIFLTIPLYYSMVSYFRALKSRQGGGNSEWEEDRTEGDGGTYEE